MSRLYLQYHLAYLQIPAVQNGELWQTHQQQVSKLLEGYTEGLFDMKAVPAEQRRKQEAQLMKRQWEAKYGDMESPEVADKIDRVAEALKRQRQRQNQGR